MLPEQPWNFMEFARNYPSIPYFQINPILFTLGLVGSHSHGRSTWGTRNGTSGVSLSVAMSQTNGP